MCSHQSNLKFGSEKCIITVDGQTNRRFFSSHFRLLTFLVNWCCTCVQYAFIYVFLWLILLLLVLLLLLPFVLQLLLRTMWLIRFQIQRLKINLWMQLRMFVSWLNLKRNIVANERKINNSTFIKTIPQIKWNAFALALALSLCFSFCWKFWQQLVQAKANWSK